MIGAYLPAWQKEHFSSRRPTRFDWSVDSGSGITAKSKSVAEKRSECQHNQGQWSQSVNVCDEVQQTVVSGKRRELPFGKQSERNARDATDICEGGRSAARKESSCKTQQPGRNYECVKPLPGNPEKCKVSQAAANSGTQQS